MCMQRIKQVMWPSMSNAKMGCVLRGTGYGALGVLGTVQIFSDGAVMLLPVVLLVLFCGMLLDSISRRQTADQDSYQSGSMDAKQQVLRSYMGTGTGICTIKKRYSDGWHEENPGWHEQQLSSHSVKD